MFRKSVIQVVNALIMVLLLIGLPAAARLELGPWEVRSRGQIPWLILWGAVLAAGLNLGAARWWAKRRKDRRLCWQWLGAYGLVAAVEAMILLGWIHFEWLKDLLEGLGEAVSSG